MSITKVAKLAGVSTSTVSRVINNYPRVADATVKAVRDAMAELKYTPSETRPGPKPGLSSQRVGPTLGFFVLEQSSDRIARSYEPLMRGVTESAVRFNAKIIFRHVDGPIRAVKSALDASLDGLLLFGTAPSDARDTLGNLPTVWLKPAALRPLWGDTVTTDVYEMGLKACAHLAAREHKHLAVAHWGKSSWEIELAMESFLSSARELGVDAQKLTIPATSQVPASFDGGFEPAMSELVARYLRLDPRPTGLFVPDAMQLAFLQPVLRKAGVSLGAGQVEFITSNDEPSALDRLRPRPSLVDVRAERIGAQGVEQLVWRLGNRHPTDRLVLAVEPFILNPDGTPAPQES